MVRPRPQIGDGETAGGVANSIFFLHNNPAGTAWQLSRGRFPGELVILQSSTNFSVFDDAPRGLIRIQPLLEAHWEAHSRSSTFVKSSKTVSGLGINAELLQWKYAGPVTLEWVETDMTAVAPLDNDGRKPAHVAADSGALGSLRLVHPHFSTPCLYADNIIRAQTCANCF